MFIAQVALAATLSATPPMGFNTWNKFGCDVSETLIREVADAMVTNGMRDAGYRYVVIDDCWQIERGGGGRIVPDPERFSSGIKALADYVHDRGLLFGIYTDVGPKTCQGRPGSYGYEAIDAETYAAWGVDYVKVDWCHADDLDAPERYRIFRDALDRTGRPVVLSICEWGRNDPWKWAPEIGELWRITADIQDRWESVVWILNANARHYTVAGPGHWNDPDMLEVGNGGMTFEEYKSHFSLWAMMAAPLMAGNDVRSLSDETERILLNREVIAVDQDPLGAQGRIVIDRGYGGQVWMKPLADGSRAVALLNLSAEDMELYVRWSSLEIPPGPAEVRDLWEHRSLGIHTDTGTHFDERFRAKVPAHGVVMLRVSPRDDVGRVELSSDYKPLVDGFRSAKRQALAYVFEGDPVGPWYEASLPRREAFCMRDVSHQSVGASALGLWAQNENMFRKFAVAIADSRDWCSYWEIDRHGRPAQVDYRSDEDFWYNLPANFDVLQAIYRVYEWTGDEVYLNDTAFENFYRRSLVDYVKRWDANGDGLLESPEENGIRGLATYWEGDGPRALTGSDLVAAQFAANRAYARILTLRGVSAEAESFEREAKRLARLYNDRWWNEKLGRFHPSILEDGSFGTAEIPSMQIFPLYFGIVTKEHADRLFESLPVGVNVEENSYLAEAYYQYGRDEEAFRFLMNQMDPGLERREYPENPFTAVGTTVRYLAGVNPIASEGVVETRSRLPEAVSWVGLVHVPVLGNRVSVHHIGRKETRFTNESGATVQWRAVFAGEHELLLVDGEPIGATKREMGKSYVVIPVESGEARVARVWQ